MTRNEFETLGRGDVIRLHEESHEYYEKTRTYVVMANYGNRVTAVRTVDVTNPAEWDLVYKANYNKENQ